MRPRMYKADLQLADAAEAVLVEARQSVQLRHGQLLQPRAHQRPDARLRGSRISVVHPVVGEQSCAQKSFWMCCWWYSSLQS